MTDSGDRLLGDAASESGWNAPGADELADFLDHIDALDREQRYAQRFGYDESDPYSEGLVTFGAPLVFELGNIRSLLANWAFVQSAMDIQDPDMLVLDYTRTMMAFLLLHPEPQAIDIIGLGGGSLAKYCYRHIPGASITGVEIDPEVIALADRFELPPQGRRFRIVCEDGTRFVRRSSAACDILMVDGFNGDGQSPQLATSTFFGDCRSHLRPGGILVVNLCDHQARTAVIAARIREQFGRIVVVPVPGGMNQIVFALRDAGAELDPRTIRAAATLLDRTHPMSFASLAEQLLDGAPAGITG